MPQTSAKTPNFFRRLFYFTILKEFFYWNIMCTKHTIKCLSAREIAGGFNGGPIPDQPWQRQILCARWHQFQTENFWSVLDVSSSGQCESWLWTGQSVPGGHPCPTAVLPIHHEFDGIGPCAKLPHCCHQYKCEFNIYLDSLLLLVLTAIYHITIGKTASHCRSTKKYCKYTISAIILFPRHWICMVNWNSRTMLPNNYTTWLFILPLQKVWQKSFCFSNICISCGM